MPTLDDSNHDSDQERTPYERSVATVASSKPSVPKDNAQPIVLSHEESAQLLRSIGELANAGLPLDAGLEALAEEISGSKLQRALRQIAVELRAGGNPLSENDLSLVRLPKYHRCILIAGIQSQRLGDALFELLDEDAWRRDYWRDLWAALSYPLLLALVTLLVVDLLNVVVMPIVQASFLQIYEDFQISTPFDVTIFQAPPVSWTAFFLLAAMAMLLVPMFLSAAQTAMLRRSVPLLGKIFWWYEVLDLIIKLRLLVAQRIPTPMALRVVGDALSSRRMAQLVPVWADEMDQGRTLGDVWVESMDIPSSILPLVRWGETTGNLPEAFQSVEALLKDRLALRRELIRKIGPPVITAVVLAALFWAAIRMIVLFLPLFDLIQNFM
ncbi:type II secretion system F family protein [Blastopirellula marina]|uniref:Type II secretion system protein GspF domain-containing protein n=1 Tax=Blastopirellula marina TaxID=124 RepID=A0A2S8GQ41_9BACT|nr:type II secretion system F family protein [Blastopirellula marina]PQO46549.1 hypothetical protein C5Y93_08735 [Blastopirellula marina]